MSTEKRDPVKRILQPTTVSPLGTLNVFSMVFILAGFADYFFLSRAYLPNLSTQASVSGIALIFSPPVLTMFFGILTILYVRNFRAELNKQVQVILENLDAVDSRKAQIRQLRNDDILKEITDKMAMLPEKNS